MRLQIGDLQLEYEETGSGTPLVLTHGLGSDLHYWDVVLPELAKYHRVVCWDIRGFGGSDKPAGPYSPGMLAADLAGLLDTLKIDRAHLAGVSMGGVITQKFALDFPGRARSLVLVSTSSEIGPRATANWQRLADQIERNGFDQRSADASRSFSPSFSKAHPEIVRAVGEQNLRNDRGGYAAAARAMSDYAWTAELARVDVPVLILQGLDDLLTPPGGSVKMSRALARSRLLMVPEAGHNLPLEHPSLFCASVLAFTAGLEFAQPCPL